MVLAGKLRGGVVLVVVSGVTVPQYGVEGKHAVLYCRYSTKTFDLCPNKLKKGFGQNTLEVMH